MILVPNLRLDPAEPLSALKTRAAKRLGVPVSAISGFRLVRRSLDARRKSDIHYVCSVAVDSKLPPRAPSKFRSWQPPSYNLPRAVLRGARPVVAGFGPAGIFAALALSYAGLNPLVVERGADIDARSRATARFAECGILDPDSNIQFGEGGAGAFSDGKLNTGVSDPRIPWILERLHAAGAPHSILYDARPHIGTDILPRVVKNLRREIISHGGEVLFETKLTGLALSGGVLRAAQVVSHGVEREIPCRSLILAVGHSARDTFEMLRAIGAPMQPKPFSMGVRIEHLQRDIDLAQYGRERGSLPAAEYRLSCTLPDGSSAYTFCMCPGGEVVLASSESGGLVTNGMSRSARDGANANSALLVTLTPADFPSPDVLSGVYWQREIERACFALSGGYLAPAQTVGSFLSGSPPAPSRKVAPSCKPGVRWLNLREALPPSIASTLAAAIPELGRRLRGFDDPEAVLTAPETRSSSPVRIVRGAQLQSQISGLYPCGEGAGYAGGIASAALDGLRCAEAVIAQYT